MAVISLTTDFGSKDGFVGTMKGVIWGIAPDVQIADITHEIPPQDIMTGAIALWRAAPFFPAGSVHIAVVDPGVGTSRRPMAVRLGYQFFVVPDNGLLTPLILDAEVAGLPIEYVHLENPEYWLPHVSRTFHGRDIFAPVGAHLFNGVAMYSLGSRFNTPVRLDMQLPEPIPGGWRAQITVIDVFGNLSTNLKASRLAEMGEVIIRVHGRQIDGLVESYGHRNPGELVALIDSENFLEVALVNGSAAQELGARLGDMVEVVQKHA